MGMNPTAEQYLVFHKFGYVSPPFLQCPAKQIKVTQGTILAVVLACLPDVRASSEQQKVNLLFACQRVVRSRDARESMATCWKTGSAVAPVTLAGF